MYRKYWGLAAMALSLLVACAETSYTPASEGAYGYRDVRVGLDRFHIEIDGNRYTGEATMAHYFHRRAQELCGSSQYAYYYNFDTPGATTSDATGHRPRRLTGEAVCK